MKTMKYLSMMLFMVMASVCFSACGDDDDNPVDPNEINNFYIEFDVKGGGLTSAELNSIKSDLASVDTYLKGCETQEAIYAFKEFVKGVRNIYAEEGGIATLSETLNITMTLKTEDGRTVTSGVVHVTNEGATYTL